MPLEMQDKMLDSMPVNKVYKLDTGHSSFFSDPQGVATILFDIAKQ